MRHSAAILVAVLLACPALAASAQEPEVLLASDSICHTFDSQRSEHVRYSCFVHSKQTLGQNVASSDARADLIKHRLSAVCSEVSILSDELFLSEGSPAVNVWRVWAKCKLDG